MRCIEQAGRRRGRARETGPPGHVCKPAGGVATARRCAASPSPPLLASRLTDVTQTPLGYFLTLSAHIGLRHVVPHHAVAVEIAADLGDRLLRDRKSGVEGKSVSVRVEPGGRRLI